MGATSARAPSGLQQYPVSSDRLFSALSDVWEAFIPPCQLLFPDGECLQALLLRASKCHRGSEMLQESLHRGSPPHKLQGQETDMLL